MSTDSSPGQLAYDSYRDSCSGISPTGAAIPTWEDAAPETRNQFTATHAPIWGANPPTASDFYNAWRQSVIASNAATTPPKWGNLGDGQQHWTAVAALTRR